MTSADQIPADKARWTGFAIALAAGTLFGVGGTFGQFLFQHRGVELDWLVTVRLLTSGSALLLLSSVRDGHAVLAPWRSRHDAIQLLLFGIFGMLAVQYTYFAAIHASNTATATVLQYTGPAMIAVWLALTSRRWPSPRELAAIALALAGTYLLVTHGRTGVLSISVLALFWGLASAVAAAFNSLQPVGLLHRYKASHITGWGMLIGGLALSFRHQPWDIAGEWDAIAIGFLLFIFVFGTLLSFYFYLKAVRLIGAQKTSLLSCAEPFAAAVLAVLWLGVRWTLMDWLGAALVLATIFLLARAKPEEKLLAEVTGDIRAH
jgi:drug/metabolite transporter (DMT)-like permease